jgi:hypothetical protein
MADENPTPVIAVDDREIAKLNTMHEHAARERAMEIGRVGYWLGTRDNAIIYIAAGVIMLAILGACLMAWINTPVSDEMAKAFAALALSALGYMFGSVGRQHNRD